MLPHTDHPFFTLANNFHVFFPTHGNEVKGLAFLRSYMLFGFKSDVSKQFKTPAQIQGKEPQLLVAAGHSWRYATQPMHTFFDDLDDACIAAGVGEVEFDELRRAKGNVLNDARMRILAPVFYLMLARGYNRKELMN